MENGKDTILKLFRAGATIRGITDMMYAQARDKEKSKSPKERVRVSLIDVKKEVEQVIYESQMRQIQ